MKIALKATRGHAAILVNTIKNDAEALSGEIVSVLANSGWTTVLVPFGHEDNSSPTLDGADILVSLGGDGTVLYAARLAAPYGVPILPINLGTLGFIAWVKRSEWKERFDEAVSGQLTVSERIMLEVTVERAGKALAGFSALNGVAAKAEPVNAIKASAARTQYFFVFIANMILQIIGAA
jgi:NAD+ kinase